MHLLGCNRRREQSQIIWDIYSILDGSREWFPDILPCRQVMLQLTDELFIRLLSPPSPCASACSTALGRLLLVVPHNLKRVRVREEVATSVAEVDHKGVRLREIAKMKSEA